MWEVKYARQNGSIDFMWYGRGVSQANAEWRFQCLADIGLKPISLRRIQRMPTDREYLSMCSEANKTPGGCQIMEEKTQ